LGKFSEATLDSDTPLLGLNSRILFTVKDPGICYINACPQQIPQSGRSLERCRKYLQDREGRDLLAAECRYTEMLVAELKGPAEQTWTEKPSTSPTGEVPKDDLYKFRIMLEHKQFVRGFIERFLAKEEGGAVSRNAILEKIQRRKDVEESAGEVPEIVKGDFRTALAQVPDGSVRLILTDPPYAESALPLYDDLAALSARVLTPGGSLVCYTGQAILPEVLMRLGAKLRYGWTFALTHEHGGQQLPGKWVMVEWKPVLWFVREYRLGREYVADRLRGSKPEKAHHEWAQGIEEVEYLIEKLTERGELVLDPFAGSGAFGRAAVSMGRRFVGVDLDPNSGKGIAC
jgi:16S rRNA G966 N2-methylase RsmD